MSTPMHQTLYPNGRHFLITYQGESAVFDFTGKGDFEFTQIPAWILRKVDSVVEYVPQLHGTKKSFGTFEFRRLTFKDFEILTLTGLICAYWRLKFVGAELEEQLHKVVELCEDEDL